MRSAAAQIVPGRLQPETVSAEGSRPTGGRDDRTCAQNKAAAMSTGQAGRARTSSCRDSTAVSRHSGDTVRRGGGAAAAAAMAATGRKGDGSAGDFPLHTAWPARQRWSRPAETTPPPPRAPHTGNRLLGREHSASSRRQSAATAADSAMRACLSGRSQLSSSVLGGITVTQTVETMEI